MLREVLTCLCVFSGFWISFCFDGFQGKTPTVLAMFFFVWIYQNTSAIPVFPNPPHEKIPCEGGLFSKFLFLCVREDAPIFPSYPLQEFPRHTFRFNPQTCPNPPWAFSFDILHKCRRRTKKSPRPLTYRMDIQSRF